MDIPEPEIIKLKTDTKGEENNAIEDRDVEEMDLLENENENDNENKEENNSGSDDDTFKPDTDMQWENKTAQDDSDEEDSEEDAEEAEIKLLEEMISQNPYDYASHVAVIGKLQRLGELERLRAARERMSSKYPLSSDLWLVWLRDEMKLAVSPAEKMDVVKLCERAVQDYLSVEIWLEYLQFSIGNMSLENDGAKSVRQLFERALTAVGLHCTKGAIIWEAFREFENALYAQVHSSNKAEQREQLDRIANLFRRQLACPLLDMEKTFEEYTAWRASEGANTSVDDTVINGGYERALIQFNNRLPYEEKIVSAHGEAEQLDAYKVYLSYEKQNGDPGRTTVLYERALADLSLEASLWTDYLTYLETTIKVESVLEQVYRRASRNVPWCSIVWQKWIRSYEKWQKSTVEVQALLENALTVGFPNAEDYLKIWLMYLEYLCRKINKHVEDEKQIEMLRNCFNRACENLANSFGLDGDPNCVILQYWARMEAIHANNMEKARSLWADILSQGHSGTASYWLEYISLERCYGDTKHLRKLYQKALTSVKDWPESIANAWIDFERDEGSLEQMEFCEALTKEKLDKAAEERQRSMQQHSGNDEFSSSQTKKANKRKSVTGGKWANLNRIPLKLTKTEAEFKPKLNEIGLSQSRVQNNRESSRTTIPTDLDPPEDKTKADRVHDIDAECTVFVSNLDYNASEDDVKNALESVGQVASMRMVRDYKGRSKGYCYVTFNNKKAAAEALRLLDRKPIKGRPMFISKYDPNSSTRTIQFKYSNNMEKNKLYVKGLPLTTEESQLREIFSVFGPIQDIRLATYRNGHFKGFAYVEFKDEDSAASAIVATDGMKIEDKEISVAISRPPERKTKLGNEKDSFESQPHSSTRDTKNSTPKTILSLIPRNVKVSAPTSNGNVSKSNVSKKMNNDDFRSMFFNKK